MTIDFEKPERLRNWPEATLNVILAVVEGVKPTGPNLHNIGLRLKDVAKNIIGNESDKPSNRAWNWAVRTLIYASTEILAQARYHAPLSHDKEKAISEFMEAATKFDGTCLDINTLRNPAQSQAFQPATNAISKLVTSASTGSKLDLDTLHTRFNQALMAASNRVICEDPEYFMPLEDALGSITGEFARRELEWARHNFWISSQFTDEPVFSPDSDETTPLSAVYLRLRCFWNEEIQIETENSTQQKTRRTAHVADLHKAMHEWLRGNHKTDAIRVIAGGPGCGKSSFARAFAHEIINDPNEHRVALIRLQFTHLTGQLELDVAKYFHNCNSFVAGKGNPGFPESPLEWHKDEARPLLLIFDGLDELTADEGESERFAREFLLALSRMLHPLNNDASPVRAIVLGRNAACEQAMKAAALPLKTMLNVAPIAPMTSETCRLVENLHADEAKENLFDPQDLMPQDQRETYWHQWAHAKDLNPEEIPQPITHESMSSLNLEPLLLHLLIISKYCGSDWEEAAENRNLVYEDILEKIYNRNSGKKHFASHNISKDDYFDLMEVLGLAAWRGNGRTGNEEEFRIVRKRHLDREKIFKKVHAASLKSVALNIHTRTGGRQEDDGFEFIHKSFGEFLTARALVSHGRKLALELAANKEPEDLVEAWVELIAAAELSPYILQFLYDEARRRVDPNEAKEIKKRLTEIIDWEIANGMPTMKVFPQLNWRELETHQRCAETALLAVASAFATVVPIGKVWPDEKPDWTININWPRALNSSSNFIKRINTAGGMGFSVRAHIKNDSHGNYPFVYRLLNHSAERFIFERINLNGAHLLGAELVGLNLGGADLRTAKLVGGILTGVNLSKANLGKTDLRSTRLENAHIAGANLERTMLDGAILSEAVLAMANLKGAILRCSNLEGANLKGANLNGADLSDANLKGVDLRGANLGGADLRRAILKGVVLSAANLEGADLRNANLEGADLRDANLGGADLSGAILKGVDLSVVNLEGAILKLANLERTKNNK